MDDNRFDELTKALVGGTSRRRMVKGLVGGALGAVGVREAAGQARCARDEPINCDGTCVDLRTNPAHCGRCGWECGAEQVCYAGRCLNVCPSGFARHDGTCVRTCPAGTRLCDGTCTEAECCIDKDCGVGITCNAGVCACDSGDFGTYPACDAEDECCVCLRTLEGTACVNWFCDTDRCPFDSMCSSSAECPPDHVCTNDTFCDFSICQPRCGVDFIGSAEP